MLTWPSLRSIGLAMCLPVLLQAALVFIVGDQPWLSGPRGDLFGVISLAGCTGFGFTFVAKQWPKHAFLIALAYFPAMLFVLFFVSIGVSCDVYGNCF